MTNWLITGISSGFGKALARAAVARGDKVVGTVRREADKAAFEAVAPGLAIGVLMDLTEPGAAARAVVEAESTLGQIDILVNNAGYGIVGAIEEVGVDQARRLFDVNLFGPIAMLQAVLPAMRARRAGRIINVTSVSGFAPWAGTGIYGASKYAMECIGQTLAQEVAPLGIHVTNVAPGGFRTEFAAGSLAEAAHVIDDYEVSAHQSKAILAMQRGKEHGDPARAAAAILQAADMAQPPRHLFLGEDALRHANEQIDLVREEMAKWEDISLSTAFPD